MNNKQFIALSLIAGLAVSTISAMAESSIYTDGIGRMHFLGKDVNDVKTQYNYSNPEQQDLTRRLYEGTSNEVNYVDHRLKNYDQTFGADRLDTQNMWKNKFENNVNEAQISGYRGSFGAGSSSAEDLNASANELKNLSETNVIKTSEKKKHWWNK